MSVSYTHLIIMNNKNISPWAWIPTLYFAQGLPYVSVMTISVIMYKNLGISNTDIALYTSWLYLPWVIKPFWSPFVDLLKTKRWWIVSMQLLVGAGLAGIAFTIPMSNLSLIHIYINGEEVSGKQIVTYHNGHILWQGHSYDELLFEPLHEKSDAFELQDVTIGINFHWERKENQRFIGALKIIVENKKLTGINVIHVEDYLTSVISSETVSYTHLWFPADRLPVARNSTIHLLPI